MPPDQRNLGLDRNTEEGALVEFAARLDSSRPSHVIVAWVLLLAMFGIPLALTVSDWLHSLY